MKSSLKFREERSPLLRVKLPMKVGPIPMSSGVTLGESPDLAVQVGTLFPAGPSLRLAFKPYDRNPISVILRMGLGSWGSANDTALTLTAELHLAPKGRDPLFSLRLKPKVGDFSVRRDVNLHNNEQKGTSSVNHSLPNGACHKLDHDAMPSMQLNGDAKENHKQNGMLHDKEGVRSPLAEPNNLINGCVSPTKVAGLEREWKGGADRKLKVEGLKEHNANIDTRSGVNGMIVHVPDEILQEQMEMERQKSAAVYPLMALWRGVADCKVVAHSLLPLGNHARLSIRWGIKPSSELFHRWDGSLQSLSFSKLPSLLLDKVSFERNITPEQKPKEDALAASTGGYLEQGLFPEEHTELVKVAAMCYSMKRQLHLMYAENQVLRRAMEDMRAQTEFRGSVSSSTSKPSLVDTSVEEQSVPRWASKTPVMDARLHDAGESSPQELEVRKDGRKRDAGMESKKSNSDNMPASSVSSDLSKELEKAILGAKSNSPGGKKS